jgi:hypothetical protein
MIEIDQKTGETIVRLLRELSETLSTIAAEVTLLSRAVDRAIARSSDPPQAREFWQRRRTEP